MSQEEPLPEKAIVPKERRNRYALQQYKQRMQLPTE